MLIADDISIHLGDCLNVMSTLGEVDLVLTDPPYGTTQNKWDAVIPLPDMWAALDTVTRDTTPVVMTAAQPFTSALVMSNVKRFKQALVWHKNVAPNFLNANRQHMARHEDILLFHQKQPTFNKQWSGGTPYARTRKSADDTGSNYGAATRTDTKNGGTRNPTSVLVFDRQTGHHPTQKPVALMEYLIKTYTNEGDTVLDFTMGSGTTGVACVNTGRKFIGIEKDAHYFGVAADRIMEALNNVDR